MRTYTHGQSYPSLLLRYKTPSRRNASENRLFYPNTDNQLGNNPAVDQT